MRFRWLSLPQILPHYDANLCQLMLKYAESGKGEKHARNQQTVDNTAFFGVGKIHKDLTVCSTLKPAKP